MAVKIGTAPDNWGVWFPSDPKQTPWNRYLDEIVEAGIPTNRAVVFWWRHDKPQMLTKALAAGYPVVMCPRIPCYFDFVQHDSHQVGRRCRARPRRCHDPHIDIGHWLCRAAHHHLRARDRLDRSGDGAEQHRRGAVEVGSCDRHDGPTDIARAVS